MLLDFGYIFTYICAYLRFSIHRRVRTSSADALSPALAEERAVFKSPDRELCNVSFYYCGAKVRIIAHGRLISRPLQAARAHVHATHTLWVPFGLTPSLSHSRCGPCPNTTVRQGPPSVFRQNFLDARLQANTRMHVVSKASGLMTVVEPRAGAGLNITCRSVNGPTRYFAFAL